MTAAAWPPPSVVPSMKNCPGFGSSSCNTSFKRTEMCDMRGMRDGGVRDERLEMGDGNSAIVPFVFCYRLLVIGYPICQGRKVFPLFHRKMIPSLPYIPSTVRYPIIRCDYRD